MNDKQYLTLEERWSNLSEDKRSSIRSLHVAAQALVEGLDSLAEARKEAKSFYAEQTIIGLISNLNSQLEDVEFRLQELWGFKQDANYHSWWLRPKNCECPKLDNRDPAYYGAGKIINGSCPIHANLKIKEEE